jgi:hypothetical protein
MFESRPGYSCAGWNCSAISPVILLLARTETEEKKNNEKETVSKRNVTVLGSDVVTYRSIVTLQSPA